MNESKLIELRNLNNHYYDKKAHKLKKITENELPERILFYDSESNISLIDFEKNTKKENNLISVEEHTLKLGWFEYWEKHGEDYYFIEMGLFESKKEFFNIINKLFRRKSKNLTIFAHSASFDYRLSVDLDNFKEYEVIKEIIDSNKFIMRMKHKNIKNRFSVWLDSMNFFKTSIEKMGKMLGIEKVQVEDFKTVSYDKILKRCKVDVEILRLTIFELFKFIKENNAVFASTLASMSFATYRKGFMNHDIYIHDNMKVIELERLSYFGGRTEVFKMGKLRDKIYKLDINSMYPYFMKNEKFPTKLLSYIEDNISIEYFEKHLNSDNLIIAEVEIELNKNAVPYRDKENQRVIFPIGKFKTVLCSSELKLVHKYGKVLKVNKIAIYKGEKIFYKYINHFYKLRKKYKKQGNKIFTYFVKLILNSLYGKFGQKNDNWIRVEELDYLAELDENIKNSYYDYIDENNNFRKLKFFGNNCFESKGIIEGKDSFVAISSFVTSYARAYLFNKILLAGIENIFYIDTDSFFINRKGYLNMKDLKELDEYELGKFKLEEVGLVEIRGLKDYTFNNFKNIKTKIKGISKRSIKLEDNVYQDFRFIGFKEAFRYFDIEAMYYLEFEKKLKREYTKGTVQKDGTVKPFIKNEV